MIVVTALGHLPDVSSLVAKVLHAEVLAALRLQHLFDVCRAVRVFQKAVVHCLLLVKDFVTTAVRRVIFHVLRVILILFVFSVILVLVLIFVLFVVLDPLYLPFCQLFGVEFEKLIDSLEKWLRAIAKSHHNQLLAARRLLVHQVKRGL